LDKNEIELINDIASFSKKPYQFAMYAFAWGKGELKDKELEAWQKELLIDIENGLLTPNQAIQLAIASGHGIGKSALVSIIILWGLCTFTDTKGVVTANTESQLKTKTWAELAKWYRLCICKHWFKFTATAIFSVDEEHEKTWRVDMIPWSERNTEAFAGLHNKSKRIILIFDEASAIPDSIWEVAEGALTDSETEILWFAFGNPTRNTGRFRECFSKYKHRWIHKQIDSRSISFTNKSQISKWVEDYGENSDFVKVRVRGEFPSIGDRQFIPSDYVDQARERISLESAYAHAPSIIALDPAWDGGDEVAIVWRQGNNSSILATYKENTDDFLLAQRLATFEEKKNADAVFIDFGFGTGVYSAGKQLGRKWVLVQFGGASSELQYLNKRTQMWGQMKNWLRDGGIIPDNAALAQELVAPEYYIVETGGNAGKQALEKKADMKKRGLGSPNIADALALTFAFPVRKKEQLLFKNGKRGKTINDYSVLCKTKKRR
jgi:hypothetical protein